MLLLLFIGLTVVLFLAGQWIDNRTRYTQPVFLVYALPLTVYILTYGLRDGWFHDFTVYENVFLHPYLESEYEIFFVLVTRLVRLLGLPVAGAMTVYCAFCVVGCFWLFAMKRSYLGISMAILVLLNVWGLGMLIRWCFALGLLYAGLRYFIDKKWWQFALCFLLAIGVHFPIFIVEAVAVAIYYLRPFRNIYVNIALVALSLLVSQQMLASLTLSVAEHLNFFPASLRISNYITDPKVVDYYFQGDNLDITGQFTVFHTLRLLIYYLWFLVWGHIVLKGDKDSFFALVYNMFALSAVLFFPTEGFELMMRIITAFTLVGAPLMARIIVYQFRKQYYVMGIAGISILLFNFAMSMKSILTDYNIKYITF